MLIMDSERRNNRKPNHPFPIHFCNSPLSLIMTLPSPPTVPSTVPVCSPWINRTAPFVELFSLDRKPPSVHETHSRKLALTQGHGVALSFCKSTVEGRLSSVVINWEQTGQPGEGGGVFEGVTKGTGILESGQQIPEQRSLFNWAKLP